jgi:hypothetical protein
MTIFQANAPLFGKDDTLARLLMKQPNYSEMKDSPVQGLAAALGQIGQAYVAKKKDAQSREDVTTILKGAMDMGRGSPAGLDPKTNINWETARAPDRQGMAELLMGNEKTAPIAERMILGDMDRQQSLEDKIAEAKALMPYEIQLARAKASAAAQGGGGGATGYLVQRYMDEAAKMGRPVSFQQALYAVQTGMRQGLNLGEDGNVTAIGGVPESKGAIKGGERQGEKNVDLTMNPLIAGAEKTAELNAVRDDKNKDLDISDAQTLPIIGELKTLNEKTFDMPYPNVAQPMAKVTGIGKEQTTALDLMQQARLEMAAPLAKQLGVNPTDRDFKSTLDRIFDVTATKESRAAQIKALEKRIQTKAAARRSTTTAPAAPKGDAIPYTEFFK